MTLQERHPEAVLRVIREAGRPVSADEILEILKHTGIGIATVYRAVKKATTDGVLTRVELANSAARYEPAELPHHHHFACDSCERVYDIHGCPPGIDKLAPEGFITHAHEIVLRGVCNECVEHAS